MAERATVGDLERISCCGLRVAKEAKVRRAGALAHCLQRAGSTKRMVLVNGEAIVERVRNGREISLGMLEATRYMSYNEVRRSELQSYAQTTLQTSDLLSASE